MKKTLMLSLVAVLALAVAGFGWAAYPAADEVAAPADLEVLEIEGAPSALEIFEAENEALAADFEALLEEPTQVANCCTIECYQERAECWDACVGQPDYEACRAQCNLQFDYCKSFC